MKNIKLKLLKYLIKFSVLINQILFISKLFYDLIKMFYKYQCCLKIFLSWIPIYESYLLKIVIWGNVLEAKYNFI